MKPDVERLARDRLGPPPWTSTVLWTVLQDIPDGVAPLAWWTALDDVTRTDRGAP